jgi:hypothetical protein
MLPAKLDPTAAGVVIMMFPLTALPEVRRAAAPLWRVTLPPAAAPALVTPATASLALKVAAFPTVEDAGDTAGILACAVKSFPITLEILLVRGVTRVGLVPNTAAPVPVSSVKAASMFALLGVIRKVPTPVPRLDKPATGNPVALVSVAEVGVPRIGVMNVGLVALLNNAAPVPFSSESAVLKLAESVMVVPPPPLGLVVICPHRTVGNKSA